MSLIPRFYDVTSGCIRIDGTDFRSLRLQSLRHHIGIVLQDPVLFSGTIRDNICYGKPAASEREIVEACGMANAWEFISALEGGLDTEIGERGVLLSGGQKQRLTIARAFLKDPRILILAEAGRHDQLLAGTGVYRSLYDFQFAHIAGPERRGAQT